MRNRVELIGYYGDDIVHACSAWTSTSRELNDEKIKRIGKLLNMLATNGHHTPFEKSSLHFLVDTDIASHIHLLKHRIGVSINGESARYKEIKEWYEDRTSNGQELKPESLTQAGGENAVPMSSLPITFIENMTRMDLDDQAFINREDLNPRYHRVVGWIKRIFTNRDMHYTSCPGPDCKKKVNPGDSGLGWYCEKCQKTYQTCNYTYNFSILVEDITGSGIYQVMGDQIGE